VDLVARHLGVENALAGMKVNFIPVKIELSLKSGLFSERRLSPEPGRSQPRPGTAWRFGGVLLFLALFPGVISPAPGWSAEPQPDPAPMQKTNSLKSNDIILVRIYQEDDLETKATIDRDGWITLPLVGAIQVGQKTPEQATALIRELYLKDYLVNPRVSLTIVEHAKLRFTVMGQVQRPGTYEFTEDETLNVLQGIAMAGGYTRMGAPSKVSLQRKINGQLVIYPLNADQMSKDKKAQSFELLPDDIMTVGERIF
jgi:polysaccharide export outer membrane protein